MVRGWVDVEQRGSTPNMTTDLSPKLSLDYSGISRPTKSLGRSLIGKLDLGTGSELRDKVWYEVMNNPEEEKQLIEFVTLEPREDSILATRHQITNWYLAVCWSIIAGMITQQPVYTSIMWGKSYIAEILQKKPTKLHL
jgi:hypothetical protein